MLITTKMSETRQERSITPIQLLHSSHTRLHTTQWLTNHRNYYRTLRVIITPQSQFIINTHI